MKRSTGFALSLLFLASSAFAVDASKFSGTWKENLEKGPKSSLTSYVNKIEASIDTVKVITTTNGPRGERTSDRSYPIGKEVRFKMSDGDEATATANWEGDALIIVSTIQEPDGAVANKETWTVSADGKTLTKQRHSHGPKGDRDDTHVLQKQ